MSYRLDQAAFVVLSLAAASTASIGTSYTLSIISSSSQGGGVPVARDNTIYLSNVLSVMAVGVGSFLEHSPSTTVRHYGCDMPMFNGAGGSGPELGLSLPLIGEVGCKLLINDGYQVDDTLLTGSHVVGIL